MVRYQLISIKTDDPTRAMSSDQGVFGAFCCLQKLGLIVDVIFSQGTIQKPNRTLSGT